MLSIARIGLAFKSSFEWPVIVRRPDSCEAHQGSGDAGAVFRIGLRAVGDVAFLDVHGRSADGAGGVVEQRLALSRVHLAEQVAGLLVVIVIDAVIPVGGLALDLERRLVQVRLIGPFAPAVREIGRRPPRFPSVRMAPSRW